MLDTVFDVADRFKELIGEEYVVLEEREVADYQKNVTAIDKSIAGVVKPGDRAEVQTIVKTAAEYGVPLYPLSKGLNWGLGSRLPVADGCFILDMGRLNRIVEIDAEQQYAVLEPGVTQAQLYNYLQEHDLSLTFNVTGSGVEASIIGNALDRGVGYRSVRTEDVLGLEVVTGNGEVLRTGFGHYGEASTAYLYPYGIGPDMQGLFTQSGLGVVTSAAIRLFPKKEKQTAVLCTLLDETKLEDFLDNIATLRKQEVLTSVVHVGNRERTKVTVMPLLERVLAKKAQIPQEDLRNEAELLFESEMRSAWTALATLDGTKAHVKAAVKSIKEKMRGYGRVTVLDERAIEKQKKWLSRLSFLSAARKKRYLLQALEPLLGLPLGIPSNVAIQGVYWAIGAPQPGVGMQPDDSRAGLKFILPTAPLTGAHGKAVAELTAEVFGAFGFTPYITLNTITSRSFGCVINLSFDRSRREEADRAKGCADALLDRLMERGYYPYRVNVGQMDKVVNEQDPYWQTLKDIKKVLDPAGVIAPGKYSLN
ncbi:FAD-binding oxidoreductase [Roseivirga sp. BDSF3-8]|uniref:FAD-binding oxidoreductase n=1 Tax=Roseivirga sp. BDSF3-8 TaxID=3241598 RepID=UPI003532070D